MNDQEKVALAAVIAVAAGFLLVAVTRAAPPNGNGNGNGVPDITIVDVTLSR